MLAHASWFVNEFLNTTDWIIIFLYKLHLSRVFNFKVCFHWTFICMDSIYNSLLFFWNLNLSLDLPRNKQIEFFSTEFKLKLILCNPCICAYGSSMNSNFEIDALEIDLEFIELCLHFIHWIGFIHWVSDHESDIKWCSKAFMGFIKGEWFRFNHSKLNK